ncbi:hypothetical protein DDZ18_05580 [Marinicauda salina]|uniref:Flavodoxin n=1 Tax=Marinicauda salina TaxID=2135793 RepID=A0A2U2BT22_9PROT|nr:hypothetical protein [Marinicauda salina]PWE17169.1 hypothetical protein DDZ18_05580 [Marinicauda salina]
MKTLIVYYSRTGTTKRVVEALARAIRADTAEIRCEAYRPGVLRLIKAVMDAGRRRPCAPIHPPHLDYAPYERVVIAAPVWAGRPALPLQAWLKSKPHLPGRVVLLVTFAGDPSLDKAEETVATLIGRPVEASFSLAQKDAKGEPLERAVAAFVEELAADEPPRAAAG